jgi:hypothetical protein
MCSVSEKHVLVLSSKEMLFNSFVKVVEFFKLNVYCNCTV